MKRDIERLFNALSRMDTTLEAQRGRMGQLQSVLEQHAHYLENLSARIDASLARIDHLLAKRSRH